jgi:hypothetical protein
MAVLFALPEGWVKLKKKNIFVRLRNEKYPQIMVHPGITRMPVLNNTPEISMFEWVSASSGAALMVPSRYCLSWRVPPAWRISREWV